MTVTAYLIMAVFISNSSVPPPPMDTVHKLNEPATIPATINHFHRFTGSVTDICRNRSIIYDGAFRENS